ncbi:hypothetical protein N665_0465s0003 [Sinapis alba]|nr:hypothetical protein N665_0465s0003 [Sinapis alba]
MACLFPCFRPRPAHSPSCDDSVSQRGHDSKNRLSDLFLSEEKASPSPCHDRELSGLDSMHIDREARFLKTCGTTPIDIKKASENMQTPQRGKQFTSSQFDSWISSNSGTVFHLDYKTDEPCGEVSEQTPTSCITDSQNSAKISTGYSYASEQSQGSIGTAFRDGVEITSKVSLTAGNITGKRKSVRFECDSDQSYSSITSKIPDKAGKSNLSSNSQSLTSLKLADEIQTHGTIFPANMESTTKGRPGVRSQFVHSLSNQTETASISKLPEDSDESLHQSTLQACKVKTETEYPLSVTCEEKLEDSSSIIPPWVKQSEEKSNNNMAALSTITSRDRPIIGMVAAHWNEKEQSQISPKWWDGNGIPNSTNKYKEDQKVSWHATPFEERLEKALSEEGGQNFIPSRKLEMEEAERDTVISQQHHSAQSTSIVSF